MTPDHPQQRESAPRLLAPLPRFSASFCAAILFLLPLAASAAVPPTSGLLGRFTFDDPEDLEADASGTGAELTGAGAPVPGRPLPGGGRSGALRLDGVDDLLRISLGEAPRNREGMTVEAWVRLAGNGYPAALLQGSGTLLGASGFSLDESGSKDGPDGPAQAEGPPSLPGGWIHLVGVFDRGEVRTYVDGRLVRVELGEEERLQRWRRKGWLLGGRRDGDWTGRREIRDLFAGDVDEIAFYDRALSAAEVDHRSRTVAGRSPLVVRAFTGEAIQEAVEAAAKARAEVFLPAGTYRLQEPLQLRSGVQLRGEAGTVLEVAKGRGDDVSPMILLNDVEHVTLRDLVLDGGASWLHQSSGHAGILVSGSRWVHVDGVTVRNLGRTPEDPGGIHLEVEALEPGRDRRVQGKPLVAGPSSLGVVIENCRFLDPEYRASFGIRFTTSWQPPVRESFTARVAESLVKKNLLVGFKHNSLEIAGPATLHNVIRNNVSRGALLVAIEADKGARFNRFLDNRIEGVTFRGPSIITAMRDQGAAPHYWSEGNVFRGNVILGVESSKWGGGILLSFSRNGSFQGNRIAGVTASSRRFAAAVLVREGKVEGYTIGPNQVAEALQETVTIPEPRPGPRQPNPGVPDLPFVHSIPRIF